MSGGTENAGTADGGPACTLPHPPAEAPARWRRTWSGGAITPDHGVVAAVADSVMASLQGDGTSELTEGQLAQLAFVYGGTVLQSALDLVDRRAVTAHLSPSGPPLYTVAGSQGREYLILPRSNFCECEAYRFQVLKAEQIMCKHVLAVRIAAETGLITTTAVSDASVPELICGSTDAGL
mmetsp:Transcript_23823/g.71085  ORF Transcript_23823/g.71085 Transcript_23823/m.71085 type:complete len:180 (-) Transcript_23823:138-677(-)